MGVSAKTLSRIQSLHEHGFLKTGGSIIELGAQQVLCEGKENYILEFIRYFSANNPSIKSADEYSADEISRIANKGLMGKLMSACGFKYCALDIFDADNTILFDLNIHEPGDELFQKFDLVTNFGTTEHVINQFQSMKTVHDLTKLGGIIYHDVPMSGYYYHGYFSYNPLFFFHLAAANDYKLVMQSYSKNTSPTAAPTFMTDNGYSDKKYYDCGIEFIFQKTSTAPFRMPLETSTSLGLSNSVWGTANPYVKASTESRSQTTSSTIEMSAETEARGLAQIAAGGTSIPPLLEVVSGWDLQRELIKRYKRKLSKLLGLY